MYQSDFAAMMLHNKRSSNFSGLKQKKTIISPSQIYRLAVKTDWAQLGSAWPMFRLIPCTSDSGTQTKGAVATYGMFFS